MFVIVWIFAGIFIGMCGGGFLGCVVTWLLGVPLFFVGICILNFKNYINESCINNSEPILSTEKIEKLNKEEAYNLIRDALNMSSMYLKVNKLYAKELMKTDKTKYDRLIILGMSEDLLSIKNDIYDLSNDFFVSISLRKINDELKRIENENKELYAGNDELI